MEKCVSVFREFLPIWRRLRQISCDMERFCISIEKWALPCEFSLKFLQDYLEFLGERVGVVHDGSQPTGRTQRSQTQQTSLLAPRSTSPISLHCAGTAAAARSGSADLVGRRPPRWWTASPLRQRRFPPGYVPPVPPPPLSRSSGANASLSRTLLDPSYGAASAVWHGARSRNPRHPYRAARGHPRGRRRQNC
jgi:hypothetical protein